MTHICVGNQTIIGPDNGFSPGRRQAIIWTNDGILLIGPLGTNFSEISIKILSFSFTKIRSKVSSAKWRPFCLGLNVLNRLTEYSGRMTSVSRLVIWLIALPGYQQLWYWFCAEWIFLSSTAVNFSNLWHVGECESVVLPDGKMWPVTPHAMMLGGIPPSITAWGVQCASHDDVIKWEHFPRYWPFVRGIPRSPVNSPHKGQWRGALMFSLNCVWINGRISDREAGDLGRYRAHYDVIVMLLRFRVSLWLCLQHSRASSVSLLKRNSSMRLVWLGQIIDLFLSRNIKMYVFFFSLRATWNYTTYMPQVMSIFLKHKKKFTKFAEFLFLASASITFLFWHFEDLI